MPALGTSGAAPHSATLTPATKLRTVPSALHRAADAEYFSWLDHVWSAAPCSRPVRLYGELLTVEPTTGAVLNRSHTHDLPDGVIYKACGNRRATVCPACSTIYRKDAFQLLRAGLIGGKSVPATVAGHPAVFATFTAPSFGTVHTHHIRNHTCTDRARCSCRPDPCHARRDASTCEHGRSTACFARHEKNEDVLGHPLCLDCYDHDHQVIWNLMAGELWRRTKQAIERHLAQLAAARGIPFHRVLAGFSDTGSPRFRRVPPVRVVHGKAAEFQNRGAVHFHALLRLDGYDPTNTQAVVPPPAGFTAEDLTAAITHAATTIAFHTAGHPDRPTGWPIAWGAQLDIRTITLTGEVTDSHVAGYLAKYSTKATEATGHSSTRLTTDTIDIYADPDGTHPERLIDACWHLGRVPGWQGLRRWAHMLGFGGHFLTKARRYSVTFAALRAARITYRRSEIAGPDYVAIDIQNPEETTLIIGELSYVGSGWRTNGDALLANTAATQARERTRIGREELAHEATFTQTA